MFITMTCRCGADLELDLEGENMLGMLWAQRFADSHIECGFMSPTVKDKDEQSKAHDKPKRVE